MEDTIEYTVHVLPLPKGNKLIDDKTPYAVTIKGTDSPVAHVTDSGSVVKRQTLKELGQITRSKDSGADLSLIVREFFPPGTKYESVYQMLHG